MQAGLASRALTFRMVFLAFDDVSALMGVVIDFRRRVEEDSFYRWAA